MGTAYTPGLTVSASSVVRRERRLPMKGEVLVSEGDVVQPDTAVARALIPGIMQTVRVAEILGQEPEDVPKHLTVQVGDPVTKGQVLAFSKGLFGLFKTEVKSPVDGKVELYSPTTGTLGVREHPRPLEVHAYISGRVAAVIPEEGVVVETHGALIQGIFGVGGERQGVLRVLPGGPDEPLRAANLDESMHGCVVVGGSLIEADALTRAAELGIVGLVAGGIRDTDLTDFLGFDIGVAITGTEDIPLTLILTEGFGQVNMAQRTHALLRSLDGLMASINGATQIRAGVIRPELVVPRPDEPVMSTPDATEAQVLRVGASVRLIREPLFGRLATVTALPAELVEIGSGAEVRVLQARLDDGSEVTVPRANVEILVD